MMKINRDKLIRTTVILLIGGYFLLTFPNFEPFPQITTQLVAIVLSLYIGVTPVYHDNHIFLNLYDQISVINISPECSGVILLSVFALVMFITPHIKLWHRFCALLFLPLILLANVFRIVSGIIIGDYTSVEILLLYHSSFGQVFIFLVVIASFIWFLKLFGYFKYDLLNKSF